MYGEPRRLRPDVNVPLFARLEGCIECTQRDGHPVFIAFLPDANAIAGVVLRIGAPKTTTEDKTSALFAGKKQRWRQPCESLIAKVKKFAPGVAVAVGGTYVSLVREGKKFAILQPSSADRLDIGIKLKGERLNAPSKPRENGTQWLPIARKFAKRKTSTKNCSRGSVEHTTVLPSDYPIGADTLGLFAEMPLSQRELTIFSHSAVYRTSALVVGSRMRIVIVSVSSTN